MSAEAPVIGSVGRLEPVKNYRLALRALVRLRSLGVVPRPMLVLVGDGSDRPALERFAQAHGIADDVRFLGWRDDVERLYGAFDIFTMTSHSEGMSISLLEAMSMGLCPVVTDVGGNRGVLGAELAGQLVRPGDEVALADAWRRHLADPQQRRAVGSQARARVETAFSLRRMVDHHIEIYRDLTRTARFGAAR
jgi:glycosyltransferase involved in cell wall biosynthesis